MKETNDEPRDRARRRLIKLGIYLTPTIISMTTFLRRADATPGQSVNPTQGTVAQADAQVTVNPQ